MDPVLQINGLTKRFGRITAVNELSLEIPAGSIYGILGPNGSGKTTTLGMVLDVIRPTKGSFTWFGKSGSAENRKKVGAILEGPNFYPYLSAETNMQIVAEIKGAAYDEIEPLLKKVNLFERKDSPFRTFSLGMKQRLAIAAALLNHPQVLILDEPTNGLDPQGIAEIRNLIREIAQEGVTILLASHLLDEVEKVCDHVAVLKTGSLLYSGLVSEMMPGRTFVEIAAEDMPALEGLIHGIRGAELIRRENGFLVVGFESDADPAEINSYFFSKDVVLTRLVLRKSTLEEQFLELTGKE